MIEVVVIDRDKPDKVTNAYIGDHAFLMIANIEDDRYIVNSEVIGRLNANDLISNLARAVRAQLEELSDHIGAPYIITHAKFISAMVKAGEKE